MKLICEENCNEELEIKVEDLENPRHEIKRKATEKGWFVSTLTGIVLCPQHNR